jgi:hypothetical protein
LHCCHRGKAHEHHPSKDFLLAFSNVQKSHQKEVREFPEKFQAHPDSEGILYEPIQSAKDKSFFSVRTDQAYRAVVARPDSSMFVLMWVDHHDDAYPWAERKRLEMGPATGAVQVLDLTAVPTVAATAQKAETGTLFVGVKDKHQLQLGVPNT